MDRVRDQLWLPKDLPLDGSGVRVAVIDSGVDTEHPDLQKCIDWDNSENFAWNATTIEDRCGHGTHIAGIIAGDGSASGGRYRGIAPGASIIALKVYAGVSGSDWVVAKAVEKAIELKVDLINYSSGYAPAIRPPWVWPPATSIIEKAFIEATKEGILCVTAAGNSGPSDGSVNRPAGLLEVLAVGAVNPDGSILEQSSRGPYRVMQSLRAGGEKTYEPLLDRNVEVRNKPDLVAPGPSIVAPRARFATMIRQTELLDPTDPLCPYLVTGMTSQATAVTTGVAALLLQAARQRGTGLGPNVGQCMKRLMTHQIPQVKGASKLDAGNGLLKWVSIFETLVDMSADPRLRAIIAEGEQLRLLQD